ncbi:T9SS type A sorting domain-containing protein [Winogradskyella eckloniae]|uniref:T9SS type A sorting domain-containing protein n=1 Tax=Winogradskyella eckloniae TaxID=1089306 RepID=UPI0015646A3E|nr:T9SS type A sorting domain-containing protein [Winogradskyella eckloniae]NRD19765.1 T9SS type A sorting domain-containing protein [Winogradskyella eckloniae]
MKKILLSLLLVTLFSTLHANASLRYNDAMSAVVSIENGMDNFQDKDFTISPNPAKNRLNIKVLKSADLLTLEVFDVLGKRIYKTSISKLEASIDVSAWKTGVYLVKISNEKTSHTKRFIKQ